MCCIRCSRGCLELTFQMWRHWCFATCRIILLKSTSLLLRPRLNVRSDLLSIVTLGSAVFTLPTTNGQIDRAWAKRNIQLYHPMSYDKIILFLWKIAYWGSVLFRWILYVWSRKWINCYSALISWIKSCEFILNDAGKVTGIYISIICTPLKSLRKLDREI